MKFKVLGEEDSQTKVKDMEMGDIGCIKFDGKMPQYEGFLVFKSENYLIALNQHAEWTSHNVNFNYLPVHIYPKGTIIQLIVE